MKIKTLEQYAKEIVSDAQCILQDIEEFGVTKSYDEVFSIIRALDRIAMKAGDAKCLADKLEEECEDI